MSFGIRSLALAVVMMVACSSSEDAATKACTPGETKACVCTDGKSGAQVCNPDGGGYAACVCTSDAGTDTRPVADTAEAAPILCDLELPTDFACVPATNRPAPKTTCSEQQLQDLVKACVGDDISKTPSGCSAWKAANPECAQCTTAFSLTGYSSRAIPDRNMCYWVVFDDACDKALNCSFQCQSDVCGECSSEPNSSPDGKTTEYSDCAARARSNATSTRPKGKCWDIASKEAAACLDKVDVKVCYVDEYWTPTGAGGKPDPVLMRQQIVEYYRGACRDGGDWTYRFSPNPGGDAGVSDAASDAVSDGG
jgi:hypothetical protein